MLIKYEVGSIRRLWDETIETDKGDIVRKKSGKETERLPLPKHHKGKVYLIISRFSTLIAKAPFKPNHKLGWVFGVPKENAVTKEQMREKLIEGPFDARFRIFTIPGRFALALDSSFHSTYNRYSSFYWTVDNFKKEELLPVLNYLKTIDGTVLENHFWYTRQEMLRDEMSGESDQTLHEWSYSKYDHWDGEVFEHLNDDDFCLFIDNLMQQITLEVKE